jgi:NTE family protein
MAIHSIASVRRSHPIRAALARSAGLCAALLLGACASVQPAHNRPSTTALKIEPEDYRPQNMQRGEGNSDAFLFTVIFSGGGMRSAAASYYLLDAFRKQPIRIDGQERPLLNEIDFMSSVSGGSIAAAYYVLHRERMFTDFEPQVLRRDMQGELFSALFNPRKSWNLTGETYGRGDYLADYFDRELFEGKTFAQMPRVRPFLRIGSTDMLSGKRVEFTQEGFDALCSRLDDVPIARAVAASSAVPGIFSPINVADYAEHGAAYGDCASAASVAPRYRHLIDGGVVDNVGASGPLQAVGRFSTVVDAMRSFGFRGVRNYAIVVLNVEKNATDERDGSARIPGLLRTISASIDGNMHSDSAEITEALRQTTANWQRQIAEDPRAVADGVFASHDANLFLIEINFDQVKDSQRRERLEAIPTALRLSEEHRALLQDFIVDSLRDSPQYNAMLKTLQDDEVARISASKANNDGGANKAKND